MNHLSGQDFDIFIGIYMVHVENMSASITDNSKATQTKGVPDGHVNGDVSCSGEMEIDTKNFMILNEAARLAGSWRGLDTFDVNTAGAVGNEAMVIEMFECKFKISDLLNIDSKGSEKTKHKIAFEVTSSDFVRINGVDYLDSKDTFGL